MSEENALAAEAIDTPVTEEAAPVAENQDGGVTEPKTETSERPSRAKERIQELVADKRAAIEYAELQRQRAAELEAQLKKLSTPAETKSRPKLADYETPELWADAVTDWSVAQATSRATEHVEKALSSREQQTSTNQREQAFRDQMNATAEKHGDFWEVVTDPSNTFFNGSLLETIKDLDNPGELAYHLANNPSEARQIAAMSPARMAAALGRLGDKMETPKPKPKPKVTEAPEPPTPLGGGAAKDVDLTKLPTKDYIKLRRQQRKSA